MRIGLKTSTKRLQKWKAQDSLSRWAITISLLLLLVAYLPTLQSDYVTQDQWRAFRYSTQAQTAYDRAKACTKMLPQFYVLTGRPLVWITECVEHAAVTKISDFRRLRPIILLIVFITALYLGNILAPLVGGNAIGTLAATAFLVAPAYSFMYFQSMPAAMVLISVILAASSFNFLRTALCQSDTNRRSKFRLFVTSFFIFILSCLIYPAWAFLVISLTWLAFGFDTKTPWALRTKHLFVTLLFYFLAVIFYYLLVKITVAILLARTGYVPHLGPYEVELQLDPDIIWKRISEAARYFYEMPPLNFAAPKGLFPLVLGLFSLNMGWSAYKNKDAKISTAIAISILLFMLGCIILLAAISPWLFSRMDSISTRHLLPWYLFFCAASIGLIASAAKMISSRIYESGPIIILVAYIVPALAEQNKLSFLEVAVSQIEIENMRLRLDEWLTHRGYLTNRYLLVIRPTKERPAFVEQLLSGAANIGENAVLSSAKNPVSIPWMVNALLREKHDHPIGNSIPLVDCGFDPICADSVSVSGGVAIATTDGNAPIKSAVDPFIINNSILTSKPVYPAIEREALPTIKASSQMGELGAQGLLSAMQPGWHATRSPSYPQRVTIDFNGFRSLQRIGFLPQEGFIARAPKNIRVQTSSDGKSWSTATTFEMNCAATMGASAGWQTVKLSKPITARFLAVDIFSNCGDSYLLTLRGIKIE